MPTPPPASTAGPPIVSQYAGDPEMRDLVGSFVGALPERVAALEAAHAESRLADLKRLAHQMKGAAGGYGFPSLGDAAGTLEATLRSGDHPPVDRLAQDLHDLVALCRRAMTGDASPND